MLSLTVVRASRRYTTRVAAARSVETDDGLHIHVPIRVASRLWRDSVSRPRFEGKPLGLSARRGRKTAAVQVRSELQTDSSGWSGRPRLPGKGARHGR